MSSEARSLSITSAICSITAIVYTGLAIQPTNKALGAMDQKEILSDNEEKEALRLIEQWDWLHKWRMVIYAGAWACSFIGFLKTTA